MSNRPVRSTRKVTKQSSSKVPRGKAATRIMDSDDDRDDSPERSDQASRTVNDKLDLILEKLGRMETRMDSFEHSAGVMRGDIFNNASRIDELEEKLTETEEKLDQALDELDQLNNRHRENNCRLLNVDEGAEEALGIFPFLVNFMKEECDLELKEKDFEKAHRLGRQREDQKYPRAIIFKMNHFQKKLAILKATKDTLKEGKYRIVPDMSDRLRRRRNDFWPLREQLHAMEIKTFFKGPATLHVEDGERVLKFDTLAAAKKRLKRSYPGLKWGKPVPS